MKKIYVGCALSSLPVGDKDRFLAMIQQVKRGLRGHFEVLEFLGTTLGTPRDVYMRDIQECVEKTDCMLAICDYGATGLGYEMAIAIEKRGIPVLAMAHTDSQVSRLVIGIPGDKFRFMRYNSVEDIVHLTLSFARHFGCIK